MKRIFLLLLIIFVLSSFTSCTVVVNDKSNTSSDVTSAEPTVEMLIQEGKYLEAYNALVAKGDEESKKMLENFVFLPEQAVFTDERGVITTCDYTWDKDGKPLKAIERKGKSKDEREYWYGINNYSVTVDGKTDEEYYFDEKGQLIAYNNYSSEISIENEYDDNGRVVKLTEYEGSPHFPFNYVFEYDDEGKTKKVFIDDYAIANFVYEGDKHVETVINEPDYNRSYKITYDYDSEGKIVKYSWIFIDSDGSRFIYREKSFFYNIDSKPTSTTEKLLDEDGNTIVCNYEWSYDQYGNMSKEVITTTYDGIKYGTTREFNNYTVYYVTDRHFMLDEQIKKFTPNLDEYTILY